MLPGAWILSAGRGLSGKENCMAQSDVKSIAKGISVLSITGIVCKVVGVLYSIPLARILGDHGLGLFQTVFPTYNLLLTLSSAGLPVAISRMVSHFLARKDYLHARHTFRIALVLLVSIGFFFSLLMFISNSLLIRLVGVPEASGGFRVIAPCVAIVCALSAFRGFIQGQQNMVPTAVSQLIEQVGKVAVSLPLAAWGMRKSMAAGAAGALAGITIVELIALIYMIILYGLRYRNLGSSSPEDSKGKDTPLLTRKSLIGQLFSIAVPVTISACIIPLAQFIDSALMVKRMVHAGLEQDVATALYGIFSGMVIRLINIPTALALAISMSLVPAISAVKAVGNKEGIRIQSTTGIRYAFLIGFPCSIGMSVLAKEILAFFYKETLLPERLQLASELLTFSALTVVLFTVVQATSSILQGLHKQTIPMYTMIAGVLCKIILNYVLIGTPGIDIHGGPFASLVCYSVSMIPNLIYCCKYAEMPFDWSNWLLRPGLAALVMGGVLLGLKRMLPPGRVSTVIEILIGAAVFIGVALFDHALTREDIKSMIRRGGAK